MSPALDFDVKDRVKQSTDIVDWIGSDIQLRRQGSIYVGHCPWHDDTRPSFQVNPAKQTWVCWPCDLRGDVFDYVMRRESVDFRQALEILAEKAGIPITRSQKKVVKGSPDDKQTLYRAMAWVEAAYHDCLMSSEVAIPVRDYLAERGITDEAIDAFQVGFAPLSWSWLVDRARNTEFSPDILEACGLIMPNSRGGWSERFRGRVIFPIRDTQQRPIALGGRVVPGIYGDQQEPPGKYVNSNETRLFSKSQNLFGLNHYVRERPAAKERKLTIVEGYTDVIAAWQTGLRNVVAALGTAINEKHLNLIKRFADQVTLVLDGDEAGQNRTNQILDLFVAQDIDLRILTLPQGQDPFDFLGQHGAGPFQELVEEAPDALSHKINIETAGIDLINDTHAANQALENILKTMASVPAKLFADSPALGLRQDQLITRLARQFQTDRDRVRGRLHELRTSLAPRRFSPAGETGSANVPVRLDGNESELIQVLMLEPAFLDFAIENVPPALFSDGPLKKIYEQMEEAFHVGGDVSYEQLMLDLEDPQLKGILDRMHDEALLKKQLIEAGDRRDDHELQSQLDAIVRVFRERSQESGLQSTLSQLHERQLDDEDELRTLEDLLKQTRERQGLMPPTDG